MIALEIVALAAVAGFLLAVVWVLLLDRPAMRDEDADPNWHLEEDGDGR